MKIAGRLKKEKPPHLHSGFTKNELMLKTFLFMCIIGFASIIVMGADAFVHILVALGTALVVHATINSYQTWKGVEPTYSSPASVLVAGMIVALAMPIASPFEITAGVSLLTVLVFKYGQGRFFKRKYLNPAAAAKVLLLGLLSVMYIIEEPLKEGMIFHPHHYDYNFMSAEGFEASMWIFSRESIFGAELSATQSLLFWQTHGWIGGGSSIVVLIVGIVAAYLLKYKWRIIVSTILTMTVLSAGIGLYLGCDPILRIAFHVFTGSVIFFTFFMATEPQTTPMTHGGQYAFGVCLAILTFVLQLYNVLGGSIIALVLLNIFTDKFDLLLIKKPFGHGKEAGS